MIRVGIDVGGTFTDIALVAGDELTMLKTPTTPGDPAKGIRLGLEQLAERRDETLPQLMGQVDRFVHGTTVATNAILQNIGAKTALLTTEGFRDSLEMRRCHRKGQWDFFTPQPPLIVPRHLRRGVRERVMYDGSVDTPLDEAQLMAQVDDLVMNFGVQAIGICFLFSFKNNDHELRAAGLIRERYPDVFVTASCEISPQIREYERTCTTVVNAFVGPVLDDYLDELGAFLVGSGLARGFQVIQSNGGVTSASSAGQHAARALLSGPAGGAIGGIALAAATGEKNLIIADMGGTSFDVTLVQDGQLQLVSETEIAGYTISLPMIGIHTIGAGGGSIGYVDESGIMKVGPRSAGALPGPACYDRGGIEPTVTDASLVLGLLNADFFLGGRMVLDSERSRTAVLERIARPLGLTVDQGAQAIFEIVNSNMVDAIQVVTVQKGYDPRDFALVAAGGASPIHMTVLARSLGIRRVIVPKASSVFCALGALEADSKYDYVSTFLTRSDIEPAKVSEVMDQMAQQGGARLEADGIPPGERLFEYSLDMRYVGQHWDMSVPLTVNGGSPDIAAAAAEFHVRHEMLHGYKMEERPTEIVNCRLMAIGRSPSVKLKRSAISASGAPPEKNRRRAYFGALSGFIEAPVYDGDQLRPGNAANGPAIVERSNTTVVLLPGDRLRVDKYENIIIDVE